MSYDLSQNDRDTLQQVVEETIGTSGSSKVSRNLQVPTRASPKKRPDVLFGMAKISAAGADSSHWKWSLSLRHAADGTFTTESTPTSDNYGECVVANGDKGAIGRCGMLYFQWGDDNTLYIVMVPLSPYILVKIISSTGNAWTGAAYTVQDSAGNSFTAVNAMEPCGGSPGPLGVNVSSSNGTIGSGTCVIKPLGPTTAYFPIWWDSVNSRWTFALPNSGA